MSQVLEHTPQINANKSEIANEKNSQLQPSVKSHVKQKSQKNSQLARQESKEIGMKSKKASNKQQAIQMSERQWEAIYDSQNFGIDPISKKPLTTKQRKSQRKIQPQKISQKSKIVSNKKEENGQIIWDTAYIDDKFYLSDPASLTKLRQLDKQIKLEREKLANIETVQAFQNSFLSQRNAGDESTENLRMQCLTQINQSKLLQRKQNAQADLLKEQQKYRSKIEQMKKKKSILKKEMGCGTNDKNLQANQEQILKGSTQIVKKQGGQIEVKNNNQQIIQNNIQADKNALNVDLKSQRKSKQIKQEKMSDGKGVQSITKTIKAEATKQEVAIKQGLKKEASVKQQSQKKESSVKKQVQLKSQKSVRDHSVKKSEKTKQLPQKPQSQKKSILEAALKKQKSVVDQPSGSVREKSSKQKVEKQNEDRKSEKSVESKGKSSHPVELNLPKLPDTGKSQKSSVVGSNHNKDEALGKKSVVNESSPSIRQKSMKQDGQKSKKQSQNQILAKTDEVKSKQNQVNGEKSQKVSSKSNAEVEQNKSVNSKLKAQIEQNKSSHVQNQLAASKAKEFIDNKSEAKSSRFQKQEDNKSAISNASKKAIPEKQNPKERDIDKQKSFKSSGSQQVSSPSKIDKSQKQQSSRLQKESEKQKSNYLVPQINIHSHSFKKTDKSVQWEQIEPSVSQFSVERNQRHNMQIPSQDAIQQRSQKSKATDKSKITDKNKMEIEKSQKSKRANEIEEEAIPDASERRSNLKDESQIIKLGEAVKPDIKIDQEEKKQKQKSFRSEVYSQRSRQVSNKKDAYVVHVNLQKSKESSQMDDQQEDEFHQSFEQNEMSKKMAKVSQSEICHKQYEKSHESMSESQIPSQKKKTSFKIHSRDNSLQSKKSKSRPASIQRKKFDSDVLEKVNDSPVNKVNQSSNSELNQSQSRVNQEQMKKLHEQISELQYKLKKVQEKQQQMIKFENNQSKVMSELEGSNAGSEPASPLGKLALTSRLKLQAKLSLEGSTVQFNTYQQKLKQTAQENEKLEKLKLQEEIGRLKKIIRDMQMEKIKSIQYDQNQSSSKVQLRRPSILDPQQNQSRVSEKWKDSLNSDFIQTKRNQWGAETIKDQAGKIKKNSPLKQSIKYHIDSPRKYNRINAQKSKQFSQMGKQDQKQQPLPLRKKAESVHGGGGRSRDITKQGLMNKFEQNQRNFHQFLESSRIAVQEPESMVQAANSSMPEAFESKHQSKLNPSQLTNSPPEFKKTVTRNFSQIIEKMKNENPEDQLSAPSQIKVGSINMPDLPECPNLTMSQDDLLDLAKKTYSLFGINVEEDQNQLCMKKYKNCVVFTFGNGQQQTILWHYSGKFYYGGWKNTSDPGQGEKIGQGLQYIPGKHTYKGQFLGGKKNGNGILKMTNGNIYDGQWVDGTKNGRGVYFQSSTGTYYSGQWRDGKRDGYGILKFSNSEFYQGTFSKSIKQGFGVQKFANGDYYKGQYSKGKFNGKGKYCWSNGSSYEGDFIQGLRHGQGNWKSSRKGGDIYIGGYQNDKKCGYGRYLWANGCVYQGYFRNDLKNGKGRLVYQDGKQIKGSWQDGNLISADQQARKMQDHEQEPLRRSIRASSLKNTMNSNQNSYRRPVNL